MKNTRKTNLLFRIMLCILAVMLLVPAVSVSAVSEKTDEIGYETYTYWQQFTGETTRKAVYSKPMYEVSKVFTNEELGNIETSNMSDVHVSSTGYTYMLDGGASRVLVFDKNYNILKTIDCVVDEDGTAYYFYGAKGIFADNNEAIYIADTNNARVLKFDVEGKLIRMYKLPDSHLIPEGFNYKPVKIAVDSKGYVYILSSGSYYGAILYSPEDEFLGFYGSNDVPATIGQALKTLWNKLFVNNAKRAGMVSSLPYTFTDLWVEADGFV